MALEPYKLYSDTEMEEMQPPPWLIDGIIPQGALAVEFGEAGIGKTFLALDWSMSIGFGMPWHGYETTQGPVVYIAAEGGFAISSRVKAWKLANKMSGDSNVYFLNEAVLLRQAENFARLMITLKRLPSPPKLVVIDTLARALVGADENSAKDVGEFIFFVDLLRKRTGATVLLVHHIGKNIARQERGSTALRGAADTMVSLSKRSTALSLECTKQKDAPEFERIPLTLSTVDLGDGQSSCVVVDGAVGFTGNRLTEHQRMLLETLIEFGTDGGTSKEWRQTSGLGESTFYRALRDLENAGYTIRPRLKSKGERYTLTKKGRDAITVK